MVTSSENPDRTQRCSFRKVSKPLMEKKRRARINVSLEQLKSLLEKHYTQNIRKRKLEKADILELTVKYLKTIQSAAPGASFLKSAEYQSGFRNCLYGVSQFLLRSEDASETLYLRLLQELGRALPAASSCFRTLDNGPAAFRTQQHPGALAPELQGLEKDLNSRGPQGLGTDRVPHGPLTDRLPPALTERIPQRLAADRASAGTLPQGLITDMALHAITSDVNPQEFLTDRGPHGHHTTKTLIATDPKPVHLQELKMDSSPHPQYLPFPSNNLSCVPEVGSPRTLRPAESVWRPW